MSTKEAASIENVSARLDNLERENRRLRAMAGVLLVVVGVAAAASVLGPRRKAGTIEAQCLVIRDREGRVRGSFGVDDGGLPALKMIDRRGIEQIELGAPSEDESALTFSDRGEMRLRLDTSIEGNTGLRLFDPLRQVQAGLSVDPAGSPHLTLGETDRSTPPPAGPDYRPLGSGAPDARIGVKSVAPLSATEGIRAVRPHRDPASHRREHDKSSGMGT